MTAPLEIRGTSWPKGTLANDQRQGSTMTAKVVDDGQPNIVLKIVNDGPGNDHQFQLDAHDIATLVGLLADAIKPSDDD